jgi:hypothetical protein
MSTNTADTKALEARVAELEEQVSKLNVDLLQAQLDDWKARIDQLEVQAHLGQMEAQEQISPVIDQLRNRWLDAREQLESSKDAAGDALAALRDGVRSAVRDLGDAFDSVMQRLNTIDR